ncbi:MAG: branched-chain amino acid transport system II carrier protein [Myxococcota bacterium]
MQMNRAWRTQLITVGLAVFSMFFGAGNLMYALDLGRKYQNQTPLALVGFLLTAVCLPVVGVWSICLFNGNYHAFFARAGKYTGGFMTALTLAVLGPFVAMPRIVGLSYVMLQPYVGVSLFGFTLAFLLLTFACCVTESRILDLLGRWISPALMISLAILFVAAWCHPSEIGQSYMSPLHVVKSSAVSGYSTLDFLVATYFGSVVVALLCKNSPQAADQPQQNSRLALYCSSLGLALLALVYVGLAWVGAKTASPVGLSNEGELLTDLSRQLLGHWGGLLMAAVVVLACLSTIIALANVLAEYLKQELFAGRLRYDVSLVIVLLLTATVSNLGLASILELSVPILEIIYPGIIALTVMNILHKTSGFKTVNPVVITVFLLSIYLQQERLQLFGQAIKALFTR